MCVRPPGTDVCIGASVDCPSSDPLTDLQSHGEHLITMELVNIWRELDLSAKDKYVSMSDDKWQEIAFSSTVGDKFQALYEKLFDQLTNPEFMSALASVWIEFKGFKAHEEQYSLI